MQEEYDLLMVGIDQPLKDHNSVRCKWVFCIKSDALGEIIRYKVQLIIKGYSLMTRVDFNKMFVSMAIFITIRCILAIRAIVDWEIHQMDVKTTILNEVLEVEIYMDQLEGFVQKGEKNLVCILKKILYKLKQ